MNDVPAIRDHVLEELAHELRRLTNHVEELHFLDIAGRLAARLARLAEEQGSPPTAATSGSTARSPRASSRRWSAAPARA